MLLAFSKKKENNYNLEEHGFYALTQAIATIGWGAQNYFDAHLSNLRFALNQRFKLLPTQILGWSQFSKVRGPPMIL